MITCAHCGKENLDNAEYCEFCGTAFTQTQRDTEFSGDKVGNAENKLSPLEETKICPYCAETIKKAAIVCRYCGHELELPKPKPDHSRSDDGQKHINGKKQPKIWVWLVPAIIVLILFLTNPSFEDHNSTIFKDLGGSVGQEVLGTPGEMLGRVAGDKLAELVTKLRVSPFEYNNYFLLSSSSIQSKVITLGILGKVYIITPWEEWMKLIDEDFLQSYISQHFPQELVPSLSNLVGSTTASDAAEPSLSQPPPGYTTLSPPTLDTIPSIGSRLSSLEIDIWPEYDSPNVLVIYHLKISSQISLPATLSLIIPANVGNPFAVAVRQPDNVIMEVLFDRVVHGEWAVITFPVASPDVQLEYYDTNLYQQGKSRYFEYLWPGGFEVESLTFQIQQPWDAESLNILPDGKWQQINLHGMVYYTINMGSLHSNQTYRLSFDYQKASDILTRDYLWMNIPTPTP